MSAGPGLSLGLQNLDLESQLMSIMDVLVRAAVTEITQLVSHSASSLRLHLTRSLKENESLRMKMKVMKSELFTLRLQTRTPRPLSRSFLCRGAASHRLRTVAAQDTKSPVSPESPDAATTVLQSDTRQSTAVSHLQRAHEDAPDVILIKDEEDITACGSDDGEADFENHNMQTDVSAGIQRFKSASSICVPDDDKVLKSESVEDSEEGPLREENLFSASELEALGLMSDHSVAPGVLNNQGVLHNFTTAANDRVQMTALLENNAGLSRENHLSGNSAAEISAELMGQPSHINKFTQQQNIMPSATNKSLDCSFCGELFHTREEMIVHRAVHTGQPTTTCTLCGKSFVSKTTLNTHMRIHTGEKPYACAQCGKRFTQNGSLKIHMRIHSGEKPYVCNECSASFNNPSNLRRHMSTHSITGI